MRIVATARFIDLVENPRLSEVKNSHSIVLPETPKAQPLQPIDLTAPGMEFSETQRDPTDILRAELAYGFENQKEGTQKWGITEVLSGTETSSSESCSSSRRYELRSSLPRVLASDQIRGSNPYTVKMDKSA